MKHLKILKNTAHNDAGDVVVVVKVYEDVVYYEDRDGNERYFNLGEEGVLFERFNKDLMNLEATMSFVGENGDIPLCTYYIGVSRNYGGSLELHAFQQNAIKESIKFTYREYQIKEGQHD